MLGRYFMTFQRISLLSYQGSGRPKASEDVMCAFGFKEHVYKSISEKKIPVNLQIYRNFPSSEIIM
jgi:hypothetical protein